MLILVEKRGVDVEVGTGVGLVEVVELERLEGVFKLAYFLCHLSGVDMEDEVVKVLFHFGVASYDEVTDKLY